MDAIFKIHVLAARCVLCAVCTVSLCAVCRMSYVYVCAVRAARRARMHADFWKYVVHVRACRGRGIRARAHVSRCECVACV